MDVKLKIAIAGVVVVGALTALYFGLPASETRLVPTTAEQDTRAATLEAPPVAHEPGGSRTIIDESPPSEQPSPVAASSVDPSILGFDAVVLDPLGKPVAELDVEFRANGSSSATARARSGADGGLHFSAKISRGTLVPASSEWTTVLQPKLGQSREGTTYVLIVARPIAVEGIVVDERKRPIAGAEVRCSPPPIRERLHLVLDDCAWVAWKATTDASGRFRLPIVPAMADAQLVTEAAGYTRDAREIPLLSRSDVEIQLKWPPDVASHVRGRVVDALGAGVPAAHVALGERSVRTDAAGRFDLDLDRKRAFAVATASKDGVPMKSPPAPPEARTLRALKQGFLPVELECATPSPRDIGAWPNPLLMVLDSESLAISGRVIDDLGAPIAGADVWVLDLTPFAEVDFEFGEKRFPQNAKEESLLSTRSNGQMAWLATKTDSSGRFEHDGLLPKSYRVRAFDPKSMAMLITQPTLAPQKDLEIVLASPARYARITGRIVDREDHPVANAGVQPMISFAGSLDRIGLYGALVFTDGEGRFELRNISREVDELFVTVGGSPNSTIVQLQREPDVEAITVHVGRGCHVQVDLSGSGIEADSFAVFNEKGKMLGLSIQQGDSSVSGASVEPLVGGRSEAMSTSDDARKLVLYLHGKQVAELPLHLLVDQLNVVRP
jgi:hypothetical protein